MSRNSASVAHWWAYRSAPRGQAPLDDGEVLVDGQLGEELVEGFPYGLRVGEVAGAGDE